jgi:hypothetical protein
MLNYIKQPLNHARTALDTLRRKRLEIPPSDARRVAKSESVAKCDYSDRSMLWNSCESASKYRTREFENENNGGKAPVAAANVILRSIN